LLRRKDRPDSVAFHLPGTILAVQGFAGRIAAKKYFKDFFQIRV